MSEEEWKVAYDQGMAVAHWARETPDVAAIVSADGDRSYAELNGRVNQIVRALRSQGLGRRSGVAIMIGNRPEFVELWAACLRAGWYLTPINWHLSADEAAYIVEDCGASVLFASAALGDVVAGLPGGDGALRARFSVGGPLPGFTTRLQAA